MVYPDSQFPFCMLKLKTEKNIEAMQNEKLTREETAKKQEIINTKLNAVLDALNDVRDILDNEDDDCLVTEIINLEFELNKVWYDNYRKLLKNTLK